MFNKIMLIALVGLALVSCNKKSNCEITEINGVKIYSNNSTPSDPNYQPKLKKLISFDGDKLSDSASFVADISFIDVDKQNNIFIVDPKQSNIVKLNDKGEVVKKFSRKGNGPGEAQLIEGLVVQGDSVIITDPTAKRVATFDLNGNFGHHFSPNLENNLFLYNPVGIDKFIGLLDKAKYDKNMLEINRSLVLTDSKFNTLFTFVAHKVKYNPETQFEDPFVEYPMWEADKQFSRIYVVNDAYKAYAIDVYDFEGKKLYTIKKSAIKISYSQEEIEQITKKIKEDDPNGVYTKKHKAFISSGMMVDHLGQLWVSVPFVNSDLKDNKKMRFDIFKDGVYINSTEMSFDEYNNLNCYVVGRNGNFYVWSGNKLGVYRVE